jgi:ribosomal protein L24E
VTNDEATMSLPRVFGPAGLLLILVVGCQNQPAAPVAQPATAAGEIATTESAGDGQPAGAPRRSYQPVQLGGPTVSATGGSQAEQQAESVLSALQPLQVLLGKWNGNARNRAQLDQPEWVWDFQSDRNQPALVMTSEKGGYIRAGRLTYRPDTEQFQFTYRTPEDEERTLVGTFSQPVQDVPGDDKKLQRTFKLVLAEERPGDSGEQWQVAFQQLENSRYLIELDRRRGSGPYQRVDTIHTQREGTSFALSDTDYGDKTCIISQGLGTMTVSHQGRSYYVCCTGCKAAFEEDPERWIAKWEAKQKMDGK